MTTMALVPQVIDTVDVPVIAAGGIADGRQAAAAFALGACGIQVGTCLLTSLECPIHENYKLAPSESQGQRHHRDGPLHRRACAGAEKQNGAGVSGAGKTGRNLEELEHVTSAVSAGRYLTATWSGQRHGRSGGRYAP